VLLQFVEQAPKFLGEAGSPRTAPKQLQFIRVPHQQRAQDHGAAFLTQEFRRGDAQRIEDELRQPLEGENVQARVALERRVRQQLAFELEGGLFGRKQNQGLALRGAGERGTDFGEAAEGFAAAGGTEKKARGHGLFSRKGARAQRIFVVNNAAAIFISFRRHQVMICSRLSLNAGSKRKPK